MSATRWTAAALLAAATISTGGWQAARSWRKAATSTRRAWPGSRSRGAERVIGKGTGNGHPVGQVAGDQRLVRGARRSGHDRADPSGRGQRRTRQADGGSHGPQDHERHVHRHGHVDRRAGRGVEARAALPAAPRRQGPGSGRGKPVGVVPAMTRTRFFAVAALFCAGAMLTAALQGQAPTASAFTAEQAAAGRAAYDTTCSGCHGAGLQGPPPLAGAAFANGWGSRSTRDLLTAVQAMPPESPGGLTEATYLAITAFILQANGGTPGPQALTTSDGDSDQRARPRPDRRQRPAPRRFLRPAVARGPRRRPPRPPRADADNPRLRSPGSP